MAIAIDRIGDTKDRLGESPVWSAREGCLYWVDAIAGLLHRLDAESGRREAFAVPALRDGFYRYDIATASVTPLARLPISHPGIRLNDGKVDRQGRFVAGSMHMNLRPGEAPLGALYRLEPNGQVTQLAGEIICIS